MGKHSPGGAVGGHRLLPCGHLGSELTNPSDQEARLYMIYLDLNVEN